MNKGLFVLLALVSFGASAQGFGSWDAGDVCYSWNGGHKSAGSFSRCQPSITINVKQDRPVVPAPLAAAPTPAPMMAPMTCAPAPKPILKKKRRAPVKC